MFAATAEAPGSSAGLTLLNKYSVGKLTGIGGWLLPHTITCMYGFWWQRLLLLVFLPSIGVSGAIDLLVYLVPNAEIPACIYFLDRSGYSIYQNSLLGLFMCQHMLDRLQASLFPCYIRILHRNVVKSKLLQTFDQWCVDMKCRMMQEYKQGFPWMISVLPPQWWHLPIEIKMFLPSWS